MAHAVQILAISDDAEVCNLIQTTLDLEGHQALCVPSSSQALELLNRGVTADFVLLDAARSRSTDELFLPSLMDRVGSEKLCLLSEMGDARHRQQTQRWKISNILTKPLLRRDVERLTSHPRPSAPPISAAQHHLEELEGNRFFLAASPAMMQIYRDIRVLAPVDIPVLILGESGVGKEIVAMLLHKYHARSDKKFLNVNCAALPTELLESELFGFEAGAFTGAVKAKPGKFELAHKGTLLLDEIGEMSPQMQAKLLHVLQDGTFSRLGARTTTQVDVRVLAATNINMDDAISEKRFREDLYYRLNAFTITVPPLRQRKEEIPLMMEQLMQRGAVELGQQPFAFTPAILEVAQEYNWPGNLRELRNFVTRTLILGDQESAINELRNKTRSAANASRAAAPVEATPVAPSLPAPLPISGMKGVVNGVKNQTEIKMIQEALSASGWNRRRAATNLNISYRALLYKIQQHGLSA